MQLTPGTRLGPYEIVVAIGAGGMGEVYRAHDSRLRRDVAIKVVRWESSADPNLWQRLSREARAASSLSHPNICTVLDTGESEGRPYLVMELLEGQTLRQRIDEKPLDPNTAIAIAIQITDALEAAHGKGITHRDIKPGNVMLVGRDHVKVLDFGLAKQTITAGPDETVMLPTETLAGQIVGTPAYLSPEVLRGGTADARSDLWALGIVLYQMLTAQLPFQGQTTLEISSAILKEDLPPLPASVPRKLRLIVDRCLQKQPERRYQTTGEVRLALDDLRTGGLASKPNRRPRLWAAAAAAVVAGVFIAWALQPKPGRTLSTNGPPSTVPQANVLFEQGISFQRVQNDLLKAQEVYVKALILDPGFAEARRFHAFNYVIILLNGYTNDVGDLEKAEEELRIVARDAPDLKSLPAAQTALYFVQGRQDLIPIAGLERVLTEQRLPDSYIWRMILHMYKGESASAMELAERALQQHTLVGALRQMNAETLRTEGDSAAAIAELETVMEQAPDNPTATAFLAWAYLDHGEPEKTRQLLERQRPALEKNYMWRQARSLLLAVDGKREEALQAMDSETLKWAEAAFIGTTVTAEFYATLGDNQKAIEWLRKAVRNGDERVQWFRRNPRLAGLQKDSAFLRIVEQIEARRKPK